VLTGAHTETHTPTHTHTNTHTHTYTHTHACTHTHTRTRTHTHTYTHTHTQGKYTWGVTGAVYEGDYHEGKKAGKGKVTFPPLPVPQTGPVAPLPSKPSHYEGRFCSTGARVLCSGERPAECAPATNW